MMMAARKRLPMGVRLTRYLIVLVTLVFLSPAPLAASTSENCIDASAAMNGANLIPYLNYRADASMANDVESVDLSEFSGLQTTETSYSFGTEKVAHWVHFCITNTTDKHLSLVSAFWPPLIRTLSFYHLDGSDRQFHTGSDLPFNTRDLNHAAFNFQIEIEPQETSEFLMRFTARNNAFLQARLYDSKRYQDQVLSEQIAYGIFVGVFVGLILYNVMLYQSIRRSTSLWYTLFAFIMFSLLLIFDGRMLQFVLPDQPALVQALMFFTYFFVSLSGAIFSRHFLKLQKGTRQWQMAQFIMLAGVFLAPVCYIIDVRTYLSFCAVYAIIVVVYFSSCAAYGVVRGEQEGRFYLIAQLPLIASVIERGLYNTGILSVHVLPIETRTTLSISMVMLAYAVGRNIVSDNEKAQQLALEQLEISNNLKASYNEELEKEIEENTAEIRQMNEDLEHQATKLLELDSLKSQFFANISHEFRTPLTLIQGPLTSLLEQESSPQKQQAIGGVIDQSKQLQSLIDQILTLSKFDNEVIQLHASSTDLVRLVRSFSSQFDSLAAREGIKLTFSAEQDLIPIFVDHEKLQIVMNNLMSNALKFTETGGGITVDVALVDSHVEVHGDFETDRYARIRVTDSGCGIAEGQLPLVFDRYFQSGSNTMRGLGTGIGLALAKDLVELHAGQISVTSIENAGSCFAVLLPLGNSHLKASEIVEGPQVEAAYTLPVPEVEESLESDGPLEEELPLVLVVDDNRDMRSYLNSILKANYRVVEAEDGVDGEAKLLAHNPIIVLTDLMMPKRDGIEFIGAVRSYEQYVTTPIIMLTAKAGQEDRLVGIQASADDYLAKPFTASELLARMANLVTKHKQMAAFYTKADSSLSTASVPEHDLIHRLRELVDERIGDGDFGVEELAQSVHMSSATLRRKLAEISSFTPSGFIRHCRLERARTLIGEGKMRTLSELANAVGFNQPDYFSRLYKKTFNQPIELKAP